MPERPADWVAVEMAAASLILPPLAGPGKMLIAGSPLVAEFISPKKSVHSQFYRGLLYSQSVSVLTQLLRPFSSVTQLASARSWVPEGSDGFLGGNGCLNNFAGGGAWTGLNPGRSEKILLYSLYIYTYIRICIYAEV